MKACFVVNDLRLSGGVGVILEHAHQLATRHGFDVTVALTQDLADSWRYPRLAGLRLRSVEDAAEDRYDVAIATWWQTTRHLFDLRAERYAYFVQSLEDRFYVGMRPERLEAAVTHDLPVAFVTEARWIVEFLEALRPDAQCYYVRNGIDKRTFAPVAVVEPARDGPLRVLVEGHPEVWFKGIPDAASALGRMREPRETTLVSASGDAAGIEGFDRVIGPLSQAALAEEYAAHHVILKTSRVEGMYGPPLEAFHRGATVVTTPVTGFDEYVEHGWNGLVVDWDDSRGAARALDLLARDRRLLHFLRRNAVMTARGWPSWEQSSDVMAAALLRIRRRPGPDAAATAQRVLGHVGERAAELRRQALATRQEEVDALVAEIDRLREEALGLGDQLGALMQDPAWRVGQEVLELREQRFFGAALRTALFLRHRLRPALRRLGVRRR